MSYFQTCITTKNVKRNENKVLDVIDVWECKRKSRSEYAKDNKGNALTVKDVGSTFKESGMNPDKAAKIILKGVKKNKKRIFVGLDAKIMEIAQRLSPSHYIAIIPILNLLIFPYFIKRIKMLRTFYSLLKAKQ